MGRGGSLPEWRYSLTEIVYQIMVNRTKQRIEYESLPMVCFLFGRYKHVRDLYPFNGSVKSCDSDNEEIAATLLEKERTVEALESFGPWMLVKLGIGCYSDGGVWSSVVEQWKGYTPAGTLPENLILD
ncbi:hypothetical protein Gotur_014416 [Gossypium turneri]